MGLCVRRSERAKTQRALVELNLAVAAKEANGEAVQAPGLPAWVTEKQRLVTEDGVRYEG